MAKKIILSDVDRAKRRAQSKAWKAANRDKVNASERKRREQNPDYFKEYYRVNAERIKARVRGYYLVDPEPARRRVKEWREQNLDRALANRDAHYKANKELIKQRVRAWNKANPEATRARGRNYRARLYAAEGTHTAADIKALYVKQAGLCVYCPALLGDNYHVDHIKALARGGSNWPSNLQLTCARCNNHKRATDPAEFARRLAVLPP